MATVKQFVGTLLVVLFTIGAYITLVGQDVRLRVDEDKSTFYVKNENNRWTVSGREFNKLFDGASRMNRDLKNTNVVTIINNISNTITIKRNTKFIRGPVIVDTYFFDGKLNDLELFPISHTVEIFNGSGFFYRYEVRNLIYDGITEAISVTEMDFGRNMKINWQGGFRWARVFKTGILKVQYDIPTDYGVYRVKLFDPEIKLNVTKIQKCETVRTSESINEYGNCTRSYESIYINNITGVNETITEFYNWTCVTGHHIEQKDIEVCKDTGFDIGGNILECSKHGWKCYDVGDIIIAKAPHQSSIDSPACSEHSGEKCKIFPKNNLSNPISYGDSITKQIEELKIE